MNKKNARDLVGKLVQHVDRFSVPDELTAELKVKLELSESIRKIEEKDVRKLFLSREMVRNTF